MDKHWALFFFFISLSLYSQSAKKRLARGEKFYKLMKVNEVLDTMLWKEESQIFNHTESFFKKHNLDLDNGTDYEFFQSSIMQQFLFAKKNILNRIKYQYKHAPYKDLGHWIDQIEKGERDEVIFSSGLYDALKKIMIEETGDIKSRMVNEYLELIVKKHKPIDLELTYNGKKVKASDLDFDVVVETKNVDYKQVSILDKKNSRLLKPEGYTYDQILQLHIIYQGKDFIFKPDSRIFLLPRNLMQVNNPLSRYSFEEIPQWSIDIQETTGTIEIRLTNVVEANVIKTKTVSDTIQIKKIDK